jgi:uncharacterized protein (TIGR03118 family)
MKRLLTRGRWILPAAVALVLASAAPLYAGPGNNFAVHPLVSDNGAPGTTTDTNLVNAWGLVASATSPWWVANNSTKTSTLYNGSGGKQALVVAVDGGPTGIVFNSSTTSFVVSSGAASAAARFIFASEDGKIRGWAPTVPAAGSTVTEIGADRSPQGAIYKGLAIAAPAGGTPRLYATDFHNARVDVFDAGWQPLAIPGAFTDKKIPKGFAPFGIQTIGQRIFVTFAKQDADRQDEIAGKHLGYVDAFDLNGALVARVAKKGPLNAPWGLAMAPDGFGKFGGDLLVGDFGDGLIHVYQERPNNKWAYLGALRNGAEQNIEIDGLWALEFGNGAGAGPTGTLYFTAGPEDEHHGLFGSITPAP